ncbi:MAG TPA: Wzz/FepE/Etk N-terminal domain-containing protein [Steroidobacteraceae bacterium]|jgi:chain length determinant protein EpsF
MSFAQLLRILWARRRLAAGVVAGTLVLALAVQILKPATYAAVTSVVIDARGVDPLTGAASPQSIAAVLATQEDIINSRAVALSVVKALNLVTNEEGARTADSWASSLLQNLKTKPEATSSVLRIKFEDSDPEFSAKVANAFAEAYLQTSLELKLEPTRRQSNWFEQQLQGLRGTVEAQQQHLSEFQRSNGILATNDRLDVENARLEELSRQLVEAQRNAQTANAKLQQADQAIRTGTLNEVPDMMSNGLLQTLKGEQIRAQARLAELGQRYDRNHPQMISATAEANALGQKIAAELQSVKGSVQQAAQIARQQVADLQRSFDAQKAHILQLTQQRDEIAVRDREVQTAQGAYAAALQRSSQLRLESQLNQASAAILDVAPVPQSPDGLGVIVTAVLAIVFGSMLAVALALGLEMLDRRVRDGRELTRISGVEVLAEVPRLRASFRPRKLIGVSGPHEVLEGKPA